MSNFGISQNFRVAPINRKLSRATNVQKEDDENIFEKDSSFVLNISKDGLVSNEKDDTSSKKTVSNKLNLNSTKANRTVIKSVDHH
jgi:hypothetical protein